jgi:hypothetical protein
MSSADPSDEPGRPAQVPAIIPPGAVTAAPDPEKKGFLFRTSRGHTATVLSDQPMRQPDAWRMIRRRAVAAGTKERLTQEEVERIRL